MRIKLSKEESKKRCAARAKIRDKEPDRKAQKQASQLKYQISDKAALAQFRRWAKKKKKTTTITDEQFIEFRKLPCHKCGNSIPRTGAGFMLVKPRGALELDNMLPTCGVCKLIKPKDQFNPTVFALKVLRRFWKKTPMVQIALQTAKKAVGRWECASCHNLFGNKDINVDHIVPVVDPIIGFTTIDEFVSRLFCDEANLQILCVPCHNIKTAEENRIRQQIKNSKK